MTALPATLGVCVYCFRYDGCSRIIASSSCDVRYETVSAASCRHEMIHSLSLRTTKAIAILLLVLLPSQTSNYCSRNHAVNTDLLFGPFQCLLRRSSALHDIIAVQGCLQSIFSPFSRLLWTILGNRDRFLQILHDQFNTHIRTEAT